MNEDTITETKFEELSKDECYRLMSTHTVGRLALTDDEGPLIFPVNFVVDGKAVVFRTDPGTKLDGLRGGPLSFEVDEVDLIRRTGWSVLIRGVAYEATHWESDHLAVTPWAPGDKQHWVRIVPRRITGRRVSLPEPIFDLRRQRGYV